MTRAITAGELTKLSGGNQLSRLYIAVPEADVVLRATTTATPSTESNSCYQVAITVTEGSVANVGLDMTVLVYTAADAFEGICRVRKAPTTSLMYLSEMSSGEITWAVGHKLVVIQDFLPFPRHIRTLSETDFRMDWDIEYSDQHGDPDPVVNMGPDRVVRLSGATVAVDFDASDSFVIIGTIASYSWACPGCVVTNGSTATPTITADEIGTYLVSCTVTTGTGKTFTGYRTLVVHDGNTPLITEAVLDSCQGSLDSGGWSLSVTCFGQVQKSQLRDRAKVILFSEDWFQNTAGSLGPIAGSENVLVVGWIVGESVQWDIDEGSVTFTIQGPQYWLANADAFPIGLEDTDFADNGGGEPTRWTEMEDLDTDRALWHFLRWRTTLTRFTDIFLTGDTKQAGTIKAVNGKLWAQLVTLCRTTILAIPCFDRYARLFVRIEPLYESVATRNTWPLVMTVSNTDVARVATTPRVVAEYSIAEISGVRFTNGTYAAVGSKSPGDVPLPFGTEPLEITGLIMDDQAGSNSLAGMIVGSGLSALSEATIELAQNNRFFDPAWAHRLQLIDTSTYSVRTLNTTHVLMARTVEFEYDHDSATLSVRLECREYGDPIGAVAMTFPGEGSEEPAEPPSEPPEEPPAPPEEPPAPEPVGEGDAVVVTPDDVRSTGTLSSVTPAWVVEGTPPTGHVDSDLTGTTLYVLTEDTIWRTDDIGGGDAVWVEKYTVADYEATNGNSNTKFIRIKAKGPVVYVMAMTQTVDQVGTDTYWLTLLRSLNGGDSWSENGIAPFTYGQPNYILEDEADMEADGTGYTTCAIERISDYEFRCHGQFDGAYGWHIAGFHVDILPGYWGASIPTLVKIEITGEVPAWVDWAAQDVNLQWNFVSSAQAVLEGGNIWVWGAGGGGAAINTGSPNMQRLNIAFSKVGTYSDTWDFRIRIVEVDGIAVASGPPTAFDVAPSTWTWLYASVGDVIYASTDHGWHWDEFYTAHGANDICVDPQAAGAIYYVSTEGDLNLMLRQDTGEGVINATLDTETPVKVPLRIARDWNSGRLWFLKGGTTLRCRNLGSWADQKTGLSGATGLHVYLGGKSIFVDGTEIWTSEDYGTTVVARKGDWATYASGINAHRVQA
jgi:hypothetical protein